MAKNVSIVSLSLNPEMHQRLKRCAKQKGESVSKVVRDLIDKYLVSDDNVIPVILKIPVEFKGDSKELEKWLEAKVAAILQVLGK
jgi:hypothetical protein